MVDVDDQIKKLIKNISDVDAEMSNIEAVIVSQIKMLLTWTQKNQPDFLTRKIPVSF